MGKQLRSKEGELANKLGTLAAALRALLKALAQQWLATKTVLSTLGKVNWAARPFLAGAYQAVQQAG